MVSTGILVTEDRQRLAYRHYCNGHDKVIVIVHGFYNSKDALTLRQIAENLHADHDVFMFDFRGHGQSSGLYTWTSREGADLKAVLDHLEGKYEKIGILSFSFGGNVSMNTLGDDARADALICVGSASDPYKTDFQFWKLDFKKDLFYILFTKEGLKGRGVRPGPFWLKKERPIDHVGKIKMPVLFIHGEKDWVIKPWHSQALFEAARAQKKIVLMKDGPHAEYLARDYFDQFISEVRSWFQEILGR